MTADKRQSDQPDRPAPEAVRHSDLPHSRDWLMRSLNQIDDRLAAIEKRLRKLETRYYVALGIVLALGLAIGLVSRLVQFDFTIAIVPTP